ncbi:peptide ABC transporter substrate-binding protein [Borrelia hispanica]|uniref:peptide ABC transporter substrate-binding protein n=1 Tax=Borrelia hispanica TaxID=40835 RepID=UPI000465AB99|nr:peptide ABC transporter substrate-binding protein [Borrelia hispanica]
MISRFFLFLLLLVFMFACSSKYDLKSKGNNNKKNNLVVFKVALGAEPTSIDPQFNKDTVGTQIINEMFVGIVRTDPQTSGYKPGLAKSWNVSSDGKVYTFNLRDNLVWSDGVPITAEGIKKSYLRVLNRDSHAPYADEVRDVIKNGQAYFEGKVSESELGIKAINDQTIEFVLESPKPYFLNLLIYRVFIPVPIHVIEQYGDKWINPENIVVSGAFKLKERIPGSSITVERNPRYYDVSNVEIDEITFFTTDNATTSYNMYQNGEIDFMFNQTIPVDLIKDVKLRDDYYEGPFNALYYYPFNVTVKPLDDVRIRKALTLAIDRKTITEQVIANGAIPTRTATPNYEHYTYDKDLLLFDPKYARELLAEAGYLNGSNFPKLKLLYNTNSLHKKVAEFIQNGWKSILNIDVVLENQEWGTYLSNRHSGNFHIARAGWVGPYGDPTSILFIFTSSKSYISSYKYSNEEYDRLFVESDFERDSIKRQDILRKAEEIIVEKDFPIAPIYIQSANYMFRNDKWTGWQPNLLENYELSLIKLVK